jgi:hypothetical protein
MDLTAEEYSQHRGDYDGLCLACQEWSMGGVEPDAKNYVCYNCDATKVIGAEVALMSGEIDIID